MKCKYELCSNESQGSSAYCSNSCRAKESRRNKSSATSQAQHLSATPDAETKTFKPACVVCENAERGESGEMLCGGTQICRASLDDYLQDRQEGTGRYAKRTAPELLNWDKPMTAEELARHKSKHHLKSYHNRVTIPGDWDYEGICKPQDAHTDAKQGALVV